ncbi:CBS domain-containing protein [Amycolatopsis cynarae]|uniref:CBS domain-containing protein n=1 Tax=Amycolatopsis cynarae TaxID=2995223 RepID=A0ABY7BAF3_9PSEU|nr:CBS domain-containing protein [Amycolatopsis sp. HUAS 11-8]WAL68952.1 CBS domain-containing protein [Amycolatopsis sp. HUAS 11-8]
MDAREIMTRPVVAVTTTATVREAIALLVQHGFAALPVVDEEDRVVGIFTEADALRADIGGTNGNPTVGSVMTAPVEVATMDTDISQIARHMLSDRLRCVPVVDDGVLVGVVSRRDLLRPLVRHDDAIAAQLRALLTDYAGHRSRWSVEVAGGVAHISGDFSDEAERRVVNALAKTVPGVHHAEIG